MSGTLWRSDGEKIPWVKYDAAGKALADYSYSYGQAVADDVCRPVEFRKAEGEAEWWSDEEQSKVEQLKDAGDDERRVAATIFRAQGSGHFRGQCRAAAAYLNSVRNYHRGAKGMLVVSPSHDGDEREEDRRIHRLAAVFYAETGDRPAFMRPRLRRSCYSANLPEDSYA